METVSIRDLRIAYRRKGNGPPLLLLHGALSDSRAWERQIDPLSKDFTVVAWDAPGCGQSADPPDTFRLPDFADFLAAFINEIGLVHPHVLGLSFGAGLALELYQRYPALPKSLILTSAYAGWAGSLPPEMVQERLQKGLQQLDWPPERVVEVWLPTLFADTVSPDVEKEAADIMRDFHPAGMKTMLHAFAEADLRGVLPHIRIPTLLLYGREDKRSDMDVAGYMHSRIPGSKLIVIPNVGHECNIEAPQSFNTHVLGFIQSISK